MFLKNAFRQFHAKAYQNPMFCATSMKSGQNVVCCRNFSLIFRLMASWRPFSFRTLFRAWSSVVSVYPHRLLAFSQNVRPGEGSVPTGPTTGKLQSLMTSRAEKGTQDLMRWCMIESIFVILGRLGAESSWVWLSHTFSAWPCESGVAT